jgi:hypothetical protein
MHIKQLHQHINNQREKSGLPPISKKKFLREITIMHLDGKINIENGEVKLIEAKENKYV